MILKSLKLFLQKNRTLMDSILETNKDFNILFIQKPSWLFIHTILSFFNEDRNSIVGTSNHSNWTTFTRPSNDNDKHP